MLLTSALVSSAFCILEVLAYRPRMRHSRPSNRVGNATFSSAVEYSDNWAGVVVSEGEGTFSGVTGSFVVPIPQGTTDSFASVWVGIDGFDCEDVILQTGVEMNPDGNGGGQYQAWFEWFPDPSYYFNVPVFAGDTVTLTVTASSTTSGTAMVENISRGQSDYVNLNSPYELCLQDAEWIAEDPKDNYGNIVPFANFGTVHFTDPVADGPDGSYTPDQGNSVLILAPDGEDLLTSVAFDESSVTIGYIDN